ncbi:MAG: CpsD/CapB family tyrosine-protein kinase [Clostridia bacterium]|nr:CpsD/CapB family tyrosine-protein kinase [Clostridia bacterium]
MQKAVIRGNLVLDYAGNEALNTICSNLTFSGKNVRKIVVTSCEPNDGKSFVSIQTVVNMARRGKRVLLMDADLRLSVLNAHYDIQLSGPGFGLAHLLSGQCTVDDVLYETNIQNVYYIPIGTDVQAPLSLIATPDFDHLVKVLGESFDMVIIDAPPVGLVIDAAEIAKSCDGVMLVLEYNKTHRRALQAAKEQMEVTGTPILGCVLNKVTMDRLSTKKYYSYGGHYGRYGKYGKYGRYGRYERYERSADKKETDAGRESR